MLFRIEELDQICNIKPTGVIHVGAHLAEEKNEYERYHWTPVIWIEAQPELVRILEEQLSNNKHSIIQAAIWHKDDEIRILNIASNSQSSSFLEFDSHRKSYPEITKVGEIEVRTSRLDTILSERSRGNFINIDIQGVELQALKSLGKLIANIDYIYVEVNRKEVYAECTKVDEIDRYLAIFGFKRRFTRWILKHGWGDALYVRSEVTLKIKRKQIMRLKIATFIFYMKQAISIFWKYKNRLEN